MTSQTDQTTDLTITDQHAEEQAQTRAMTVVARASSQVTKDEWATIAHQANTLAKAMMVPREYRNKPADIVAAALIGRELGMSPMMSLQNLHVIEGRPTLKAQTMVALVRAAGHSITTRELRADDGTFLGVECHGQRKDTGDEETASFTMTDAQTAQLAQKDNWRKYPDQMCYARAVSKLCRRLYPDVIIGISYTPEEMRDVIEGTVIERPAQQPAPQAIEAAPAQASAPTADDPTVDDEPLEGEVIEPEPTPQAPDSPTEREGTADEDIDFPAPPSVDPETPAWYAGIPTFGVGIPWNQDWAQPDQPLHHLVRQSLESGLCAIKRADGPSDASHRVEAVLQQKFVFPDTPTNAYAYEQLRKLGPVWDQMQQAEQAELVPA